MREKICYFLSFFLIGIISCCYVYLVVSFIAWEFLPISFTLARFILVAIIGSSAFMTSKITVKKFQND
jgi:CHASE2 domain-containing sensor protein